MGRAWPILIIFVFFDCMQIVALAVISGLKQVSKVSHVTMISYWIFGIPVSYVSMFVYKKGLAGLWYGPTIACAINYIYYKTVTEKADWQAIADEHQQDMKGKDDGYTQDRK